jgi:large subunit ribosomal protein L18
MMKSVAERALFRKLRVRSKISGTPERPRLSVHRSLKHIYAQVIDDTVGRTLASASTREKGFAKVTGVKAASAIGEAIGKKAVQKGIKKVVFDRSSRNYHGRIKALADGARQAGLEF